VKKMSENIATYVLPDPMVRVVDGEYRLTGKATPIREVDNVLDALREAGVYNSQADVYNGPITFSSKLPVKHNMHEKVDEILSIIDRKKLSKDLNRKGYAFLTTKERSRFTDHREKGLVANVDRIVQDIVYQELSKELESVRHLKLQESVELMQSDEKYRVLMSEYSTFDLEAVESQFTKPALTYKTKDESLDVVLAVKDKIMTETASVLSFWDKREARSSALAGMPLETSNFMVAVLKSANSEKI